MLKITLYVVFIFVVSMIGFIFASRNETEIAIDLLFGQTATLSVGLWLLSSFIVGCALVWLISWPSYVMTKLKNKKQAKKIINQQEEISRLKGESAKGN